MQAIKLFNENDKKRAAQAKAYEKQIHKRDKEICSMKEHMQLAATLLKDLQAENAALKSQVHFLNLLTTRHRDSKREMYTQDCCDSLWSGF
jgi:hypothetical protein